MTDGREPAVTAERRIRDFIERYATWMKEVSAAASQEPAVAASLADLMKTRLATELDAFVELEVRLRAFERRAPEPQVLLKRVGNDG